MSESKFPVATDTDQQGRTGVHLVGLKVHQELAWIFREKATSDIGIDGEVELRTKQGVSHGRLLAVQIKCGPSYLKEQDKTSITYRGDYQHLRYWADYSVPVIVVICDPAKNICWWGAIDLQRVIFHEKGWSLKIPKVNVLDRSAASGLQKVASRLQKKDIIELALRDWIGWSFEHRMRLATDLQSPHDYSWFGTLGKMNDDFFMIDYVLADVNGFDMSAVDQFIQQAQANHRMFEYRNMLLGFVSESKHHLRTLPEPPLIQGLRIEYVPLLIQYEERPSLNEVGTDDEVIFYYEGSEILGAGVQAIESARKSTDGRGGGV